MTEQTQDPEIIEGGEGSLNPLAPFSDDLPYDRNRVIQETQFYLLTETASKIQIGRRLVLLKEHEDDRTFGQMLVEDFKGMPRQRALEYRLFAIKAAKSQKFCDFAGRKGNWAKTLALLWCCQDEDLEQLEAEDTLMGLTLGELDRLSVIELKALIKKLKKENKEGVDKATAELTKEIKGLRSDKEALEAALNGPEVDEVFKIIKKAEDKMLDAVGLLRQVPPALLEREAGVRNLVFGSCEMLRRLIDQLEGEAQGALNRALAAEESEE